MSLLTGVNTASNAEKQTDRVGGFSLLESGVHNMVIEVAYLSTAASGARALVFHLKGEQGSFRTTQYFTSGTAKGCKTYFEKDGKQYNLPGFVHCNDIFKACGIPDGMAGAQTESVMLKLYSKEAQGEVPTSVQHVANLKGKTVALGIVKQTVDKTALGGDNEYHPTGETRDENDLSKVFMPDGRTIAEAEAVPAVTEPVFIITWLDKFKGKVINKAKGAANGGTAGAPTTPAAKKTLFK